MKIDVLPFDMGGAVDGLLSDFIHELEKIVQSGLPLNKIECILQPAPPDGLYKYKLVCADGRKWEQTLKIDASGDIWHTFNVNDIFLLSEFASFRAMRDLLEQFIHLGLTSLKVDF